MGRKLSEYRQTHGKYEDENPYFDTVELIEAKLNKVSLGDSEDDNLNSYIKKLNSFNLHDLQAYATNVGVIPTDNKDRLIKNLIKQWKLEHC